MLDADGAAWGSREAPVAALPACGDSPSCTAMRWIREVRCPPTRVARLPAWTKSVGPRQLISAKKFDFVADHFLHDFVWQAHLLGKIIWQGTFYLSDNCRIAHFSSQRAYSSLRARSRKRREPARAPPEGPPGWGWGPPQSQSPPPCARVARARCSSGGAQWQLAFACV